MTKISKHFVSQRTGGIHLAEIRLGEPGTAVSGWCTCPASSTYRRVDDATVLPCKHLTALADQLALPAGARARTRLSVARPNTEENQ